MNTYKKLNDGNWGVACDAEHAPGTTVTVTLKDGRTKDVTVGEAVSGSKWGWVYAIMPAPKPELGKAAVGDVSGILDLFEKAKKHLKYPAIYLSVPEAEMTVRLFVAGPRAQIPGSVTVLNADDKSWVGRITTAGEFQISPRANGKAKAIVDRVKAFACDPTNVAASHHKLTGHCCFCNVPIGRGDDIRSVNAGYGPVCAKHYGLPWGK